MVAEFEGLEAATCTTDSGSHHRVATELLELGLHTLCEKPLALTIRGCRRIIDAAPEERENPLSGGEFPSRPHQPAGAGVARRRRHRRAAVHHGDGRARPRHHDDHALAASEALRDHHARRRRP